MVKKIVLAVAIVVGLSLMAIVANSQLAPGRPATGQAKELPREAFGQLSFIFFTNTGADIGIVENNTNQVRRCMIQYDDRGRAVLGEFKNADEIYLQTTISPSISITNLLPDCGVIKLIYGLH